ncbi:hypothetical protein ACFSSG_17940 [Euzebyella marina]|nr:hypothetical protein [Euzebyella marina]
MKPVGKNENEVEEDERARERLHFCERSARVNEGTFIPTVSAMNSCVG